HIDPAGWLIDGYQRPSPDGGTAADAGAPDGGPVDGGINWNFANLRFSEYKSVTPSGALVDGSQRIPQSQQPSGSEAAQLRDPTYIFGGWNPKAASSDGGTD